MSFIRPELRAVFWRWRESLTGLGVSAFGIWASIAATGLAQNIGMIFVVAGAVLTFAGLQRARFRVGTGGPGLVQVIEGQVTYFGPHDGGTVAIRQLSRIELDPRANPTAHWLLTQPGLPTLAIPTTAAGAEALFDVFAALDGIKTERMLAELKRAPDQRVVIWQAGTTLSLH